MLDGGMGSVEETHLRAAEPRAHRRRVASHEPVERLEQDHAHGPVPVRCHRPHLVGHGGSWWIKVGHGGSWWVMVGHDGSWWVMVGHGGSWWVMVDRG